MIYVTQGHEKGIGLEIFFKSFFLLSKAQKSQIKLVVTKKTLNNYLQDLKIKLNDLKDLDLILIDDVNECPSTTTLIQTLKIINEKDILITLPTSKDQLILNGQKKAGYTEFFRDYFHNNNISMTFKGFNNHVLLVTDHVPLKEVTTTITKELIVAKLLETVKFYEKYFYPFDDIFFAAINPHIGENGLLGNEDQTIYTAIDELKKSHPQLPIRGVFSGDTLHIHEDKTKKQLEVYMYHDQGLAKFKSAFGLVGLNISMGLPFLRLSVDHGTAFDLYGKNKANFMSMSYLFKTAFEVHAHVNKRN